MDLDDGLRLRELALELGVLLLEGGEFVCLLAPLDFVLREVFSATRPGLEGVDATLVISASPVRELGVIEAVFTQVSTDLAGALEGGDGVEVCELVFGGELAACGLGDGVCPRKFSGWRKGLRKQLKRGSAIG